MFFQFAGLEVLPDQMPAVNAFLIIVFIPLFESVIYPLFAKCNLLTRYVVLTMLYLNIDIVDHKFCKC